MGAQISESNERRAIILAGGDGVRLSRLTSTLFGQRVPKQFCPLIDGQTLLETTMRRASLLVPIEQTLTVVNRAHEEFYWPLLARLPYSQFLVQPANKGTAPAILTALLSFAQTGYQGPVVIFPSDHYVSDDSGLMRHVDSAFAAVESSPQLIVLLGATPDKPETGYGWIEPGEPLASREGSCGNLAGIRRFWEKPSFALAHELFRRGCLWNSFILVARVDSLLQLIIRAIPELSIPVRELQWAFGTTRENQAMERFYNKLPLLNFSDRVLAPFPEDLAVLPFAGIEWTDLGEPARLLAVASSVWPRPHWLDRLRLARIAERPAGPKLAR